MVGNVFMLLSGIILIPLSGLFIFVGGAVMYMEILEPVETETPKGHRKFLIASIIIVIVGIVGIIFGCWGIKESHIRLKFINTEKNKEEDTTETNTETTTEVTTIVINGETYVLQK